MVEPVVRRRIVDYLRENHSMSERRACKVTDIGRSSYRYQCKPDQNQELRNRLKELAEKRRKFGCARLLVLLRREGYLVSHKRVERLYREGGLSLRRRKRKKRIAHLRVVREQPQRANQHWSMDFVADSIWSGRRFRILTIVDKKCPALEADHSLTGKRVTRVLDRLALTRGLPEMIIVSSARNA